uniref:Uncharacterized protein n=1 Tax=Physcomitrium patens TaxID=3218 RepID=A0A2K1KXR8_PHYPA|nr:hypothetical protein PHYPA_005556 [Physcomitrium patens]
MHDFSDRTTKVAKDYNKAGRIDVYLVGWTHGGGRCRLRSRMRPDGIISRIHPGGVDLELQRRSIIYCTLQIIDSSITCGAFMWL